MQRPLSHPEIAIAQPVFQTSLPWKRIMVSNRLGLGDRPYTLGRTIHVGPVNYCGMDLSIDGKATLVHELTHVWQSEHDSHRAAYIIGSLSAQIKYGLEAYNFIAGKNWDQYNQEQQASIVEEWFKDGQREQ